jgi:hypothetical protein
MPKPAKPKSRPKAARRKRSAQPPARPPKPRAKPLPRPAEPVPPAEKRQARKSRERAQFEDATNLRASSPLPRAVLEPGMRDLGGRYLDPLSPKARRAILRYRTSKLFRIVTLLRAPGGASLEQLMAETGRQAHSVRGAIAGPIKRRLGLSIISTRIESTHVYQIC